VLRMVHHEHGGDAWAVSLQLGCSVDDLVELSASMNPVFEPAAALLASGLSAVTRYPDATLATAALADAIGVDSARVLLTNGGSEAIALVARHLGGGEVVDPEFSLYRRHLPRTGAGLGRWRSNPSNPVGLLAAADDEAAVWDEAFYPLAAGCWTRGDDAAWRVGSLTKLWSCPGLRIGYAIAPSADDTAALAADQPRWSVNGLALSVLPMLLAETDLTGWATRVQLLRGAFVGELRSMGFSVTDTDVNWVLVHQAGLRESLLAHRVLVRDCASFGMAGVARIAVPRPRDLGRVLAAFAAVAAR
jgi:histidinol-phosphate/aromatic aminotransferase/cobyric acid decarboxylase-like protein